MLPEFLDENSVIQRVNRCAVGIGFGLADREGAAAKRGERYLGLLLAVLLRHADSAYGAREVSVGSNP